MSPEEVLGSIGPPSLIDVPSALLTYASGNLAYEHTDKLWQRWTYSEVGYYVDMILQFDDGLASAEVHIWSNGTGESIAERLALFWQSGLVGVIPESSSDVVDSILAGEVVEISCTGVQIHTAEDVVLVMLWDSCRPNDDDRPVLGGRQ
jgi:hypothetical protein